ncbi:type II secretion system protein M [Vibrio sp. S11_S32]|uniref:type II secretion system protein M n=1 Tax=Vibrio sp. S11_S32 TaxID=2720225 RepID=UPI00188B8039|nr:type II secretion system protein M [Vibrio sp. S11_S32]
MNEKITAYIAPLSAWWNGISLRERRLVLACSGLLILGFLYWGIFQPLSQRAEEAQLRLNGEKQLLSWVTKSANSIVELRATKGGGQSSQRSLPINQVIATTAPRFNIELIRMQPRDEMLQVWIQPLAFNQLINWVAELRDNYGLQVQFLDVNRGDKSGMVEVNRLQFTRG